METLRLNRNLIDTIEIDAFYNQTKLKILDLSWNSFAFDENTFTGLEELEMLSLSGNTYNKTENSNLFANLTRLEVLNLCDCDLTGIDENFFRNLQNLQILIFGSKDFIKIKKKLV